MSAPATNVVAWAIGRRFTDVWHLEYTTEQGRTLCMRTVGPGKVSRVRHGKAKTCTACLRVLDYETAKRLELTK